MSNDPGDPHLRRMAVDPDAFEAFYREHLDAIHRFVARRVADPHHASDLVADIFLAAIDGAATYDPRRGPPVAWLFGDRPQRRRRRPATAGARTARVRARRWPATARGRRHRRGPGADRRRRGSPGGLRRARAPASPTSAPSSGSSPSTGSRSATPPEPSECSRSPRGSGFTVPVDPSPPPSARPPTRRPATDPSPTGSSRGAADGRGGPAVTTTPTPQRPLQLLRDGAPVRAARRGPAPRALPRRRAGPPSGPPPSRPRRRVRRGSRRRGHRPPGPWGLPRLRGVPELRRLGDRDHPTGGGCGRPPAGTRRQRRRRAGRLRPQRVCL